MHDIESSASRRGKPRTLNRRFQFFLGIMRQSSPYWLRQDNQSLAEPLAQRTAALVLVREFIESRRHFTRKSFLGPDILLDRRCRFWCNRRRCGFDRRRTRDWFWGWRNLWFRRRDWGLGWRLLLECCSDRLLFTVGLPKSRLKAFSEINVLVERTSTSNQSLFCLDVVRIRHTAVDGANSRAGFVVVKTYALRAQDGVDDIDGVSLADGVVGAFGLTRPAVNALISNHRRH
jgi:hypothetical protein